MISFKKYLIDGDVVGFPKKKNRFSSAFKGAESGPQTGSRKVVADRKHFDTGNQTNRKKENSDNPYEETEQDGERVDEISANKAEVAGNVAMLKGKVARSHADHMPWKLNLQGVGDYMNKSEKRFKQAKKFYKYAGKKEAKEEKK